MRYQQLMILVALATFAAASTAAAVPVALSWRRIATLLAEVPALARARALLLLRFMPVAAGLAGAAIATAAFLRYEPPATTETPQALLSGAAAFGAGLLLLGIWRAIVRWRTTSRFLERVARTATRVSLQGGPVPTWQVETGFPIVALAGVWRPHLVVARRLLEDIPSDEMQVIVKHELAHARQRDNVAQLVLAGLPDVLSFSPDRIGLERAWQDAAEDAADEIATGDDPQARMTLASALVRVARMVGAEAAAPAPVLAFDGGDSIERRVRRLLETQSPAAARPSLAIVATALVVLATAFGLWLTSDAGLLRVHNATEWLVNVRR